MTKASLVFIVINSLSLIATRFTPSSAIGRQFFECSQICREKLASVQRTWMTLSLNSFCFHWVAVISWTQNGIQIYIYVGRTFHRLRLHLPGKLEQKVATFVLQYNFTPSLVIVTEYIKNRVRTPYVPGKVESSQQHVNTQNTRRNSPQNKYQRLARTSCVF